SARGLLAYLLSRPDDWHVRTEHLVDQAPCTDYRLRQALAELQRYGYAGVQQRRRDDGKLDGSEWVIRERPGLEDGGESGRARARADEVADELQEAEAGPP